MTERLYYIIEHPTRGVLKDLEGTGAGFVGRFSVEGLRNDGERFHSVEAARRAKAQITPPAKRDQCVIRSSYQSENYWQASWPVVT